MVDYVIGNDDFGRQLAVQLGCRYRQFLEDYYPDGEPCPKVLASYNEIEGTHVVIAARIKQNPGKEGIALYLHNTQRVLGSLTDPELFNAKRVDVLMPYFLLGRQDHNPRLDTDEAVQKRDAGKDVGYVSMLKICKALGASRILTFYPHFHRKEGTTRIHGVEVCSLSAAHALARYFKDKASHDTIIASPDMGASGLSDRISSLLGLRSAALDKKRITKDIVQSKTTYDAKGLNVIFVDDVISTAGTIRRAVESLVNVKDVTVACIHAVLPKIGEDRLTELQESGRIKEIVATDTVDSAFSKTSVIPEAADFLRGLGQGRGVSPAGQRQ